MVRERDPQSRFRMTEWEVVTVRIVPCRDRAVSKHSDWLSDDFARRDWLNTMSSTPYRNRNSVP